MTSTARRLSTWGGTVFQRYSQKAIEQIQALVDEHGLDEV
jgi:hypothetical protein